MTIFLLKNPQPLSYFAIRPPQSLHITSATTLCQPNTIMPLFIPTGKRIITGWRPLFFSSNKIRKTTYHIVSSKKSGRFYLLMLFFESSRLASEDSAQQFNSWGFNPSQVSVKCHMTSSNVILLSLKFESTMLSSWCEDPNYLARDALYLLSHSYIVLCLLLLGSGEASFSFFAILYCKNPHQFTISLL